MPVEFANTKTREFEYNSPPSNVSYKPNIQNSIRPNNTPSGDFTLSPNNTRRANNSRKVNSFMARMAARSGINGRRTPHTLHQAINMGRRNKEVANAIAKEARVLNPTGGKRSTRRLRKGSTRSRNRK